MDDDLTCSRCGGALAGADDEAAPCTTSPPEDLRRHGWVGWGTGDAAHLGCLTAAESEVLLAA